MTISYNKLWKILIDRGMKKKDLKAVAGINDYVIGKLNRNEHVTTETIAKICSALNYTFDDIAEFTEDE